MWCLHPDCRREMVAELAWLGWTTKREDVVDKAIEVLNPGEAVKCRHVDRAGRPMRDE